LAFNFNNDAPGGGPSPLSPGPSGPVPGPVSEPAGPAAPAADAAPVTSDNPQSAAFVRFNSCRWQEPADKDTGSVAFCTHREVKPYAGTAGFDANAWCSDCQYYKLRRAPKKRDRTDEYSY